MSELLALWANDDEDRSQWNSMLADHAKSKPACFPAFLDLLRSSSDRPVLLVWKGGPATAVMPLLVRDIVDPDGAWRGYDAQGAYGYSTAQWLSGRSGDEDAFWAAVGDWASREGLVSIVARLPVAGNWMEWPSRRYRVAANVVRDLRPSQELWTDFEHKVRKNVKKATRSGVSIRIGSAIDHAHDFLAVYAHTMGRREASTRFHLEDRTLGRLYDELGHRAKTAVAFLDGVPVSAELVLLDGTTMLSFLGGTHEEAFPYRPNDLLKYELMVWGYERGFSTYVLGGGADGEDGIFRYKKSFAPNGVVDFEIGELRVLPERYVELEQLLAFPPTERSARNQLPRYRH